MADELAADPVTATDILEAIPVALRSAGPWVRLEVPRVEGWMAQMCELFPKLAEIEQEARQAESSDDPEAAFAAFASKPSKEALVRNLADR